MTTATFAKLAKQEALTDSPPSESGQAFATAQA